jgi:DNA invertase Pin-like site-specific DNA recombinase
MGKALVVQRTRLPQSQSASRAAQYVRMSTDYQRYSIENQAAVIATYAEVHHLSIVRTYRDDGVSGLKIKNRIGLTELISDVASGKADFDHILVYDISRWGRFQDIDESAHYEFICKQAGIKVHYCAEQFDNDGSMLSSIVKNLKRVMAAEYSRELSTKVFAGHSRLVRLGFRHGGPLGYGLGRELFDEQDRLKGQLKKGEYKSIRTDRIGVRPGTDHEVAVVRWIFDQCLLKKSDAKIARELNQRAVPTGTGRPWKSNFVSRVLQNENYIGNIVFNRTSHKLKTRTIQNPPDKWIRSKQCIEPMVDLAVWERVQHIIEDRRTEISDDEMLLRLRKTLQRKGRLSMAIIDETSGLPCADTYLHHFGSLREAYRLIGYTAERDYAFFDDKSAWHEATANLMREVETAFKKSGRHVTLDFSDEQLRIEGKTNVLFRVARSFRKEGHLTQSRIPRMRKGPIRWIVAIRLTDDNKSVRDYLLIPATGLAEKQRSGAMVITDKSRTRLNFQSLKTASALAMSMERQIASPPKLKKRPNYV